MNFSDARCEHGSSQSTSEHSRLLIVEPVRLLRWSLSRYLSQWFDVEAVATMQEAEKVFENGDVDAVLVSDALPGDGAHLIEMRARHMNSCTRIIHMLAQPVTDRAEIGLVRHIEKPFELVDMKKLLQEVS